MLFDTTHSDIVIVPPKPDAFLGHHDEFSYSNLFHGHEGHDYHYGGDRAAVDCGASSASTAPTEGTAASTGGTVVSASSSNGSAMTLSSSFKSERSSAVSFEKGFDSSVFDDAAAAARRSSRGSLGNSAGNNIANTTGADTATNSNDNNPTNSSSITRDPRNGAFTFSVHAEYDLLLHVQKDLDKYRRAAAKSNNNNSLSDVQLSKIIMRSIDGYCNSKQWMYHIGSQKGKAIGRFLKDGVASYLKRSDTSNNEEVKKFVCVDLGTYCGYSALVLASSLRQYIDEHPDQKLEFEIYTTEVSSKLLFNVAQSVFRLSKMDKYITPVLMKSDGEESLSRALRKHGVTEVDFALFDHAKHLYLDDLRDLERSGMLRAGSYVSADNVVFNRLDQYREHIRQLELKGVVESRLEEMNLEYSNNLKDGIEMTVYLKDPPVSS